MRIIYDSVLTMLTESYQNWSMLVEATAFQSWRVFYRDTVYIVDTSAGVCGYHSRSHAVNSLH